MKVLLLLAILSSAKADVESCRILKNIYEAFECIPRCINSSTGEPTKYSCLKSPYITNFSNTTCYFQGKLYAVGERVPTLYPVLEGTDYAHYICFPGGYFDFDVGDPIVPPTNDTCIASVLYSQDQFFLQQAPLYVHDNNGSTPCPYRWTSGDGSGLTLPSAVCQYKPDCCQFMEHDIVIGEWVVYAPQQTMCYCGCPPLMHCFSIGE